MSRIIQTDKGQIVELTEGRGDPITIPLSRLIMIYKRASDLGFTEDDATALLDGKAGRNVLSIDALASDATLADVEAIKQTMWLFRRASLNDELSDDFQMAKTLMEGFRATRLRRER